MESTKRKITVYNDKKVSGFPFKMEVEAWCCDGAEGFRAFFFCDPFWGPYLCEAHGDDGHWWLESYMDKHWTNAFKRAVAEIETPAKFPPSDDVM